MIKVNHSLKFVTEFDESHPIAKQFFLLDEISQVRFLESMLKTLIAPVLGPTLEKINANGSYAILKVAE